jgi:hypothetical protein
MLIPKTINSVLVVATTSVAGGGLAYRTNVRVVYRAVYFNADALPNGTEESAAAAKPNVRARRSRFISGLRKSFDGLGLLRFQSFVAIRRATNHPGIGGRRQVSRSCRRRT